MAWVRVGRAKNGTRIASALFRGRVATSARVTGKAGEKKRVRFAPSQRVIADAWFQLLSESTSVDEQLRDKLQG